MALPKIRSELCEDQRITDRILTTTVQFVRGLSLDQYLELIEFIENSNCSEGQKEAKLRALEVIRSVPVAEESQRELELAKAG